MTKRSTDILAGLRQLKEIAEKLSKSDADLDFEFQIDFKDVDKGIDLQAKESMWGSEVLEHETHLKRCIRKESDWYEVIRAVLKERLFRVWFDRTYVIHGLATGSWVPVLQMRAD